MSAREDLLEAALQANWGTQLQLAWTDAFLLNLDLTTARTHSIKLRFSLTPSQALDQLALLLPLIDQTYPPGSFALFLSEVVAADAAIARDY